MSYDVSLLDPVTKNVIEVEEKHFMQGGTYQIGGCNELWLNITYNYGPFYREAIKDGIYAIEGKNAAESIPILEKMIARIEKLYPKQETDPDYWKPTAGNALRPLHQLLAMARIRPDGVWSID